jgi:hypothetical protein
VVALKYASRRIRKVPGFADIPSMKVNVCACLRILRLILVLLALAAPASGDVIVYKGSARAALDGAAQFSKTPKAYLVVDLDSKTGYLAFYYKLDGAKNSQMIPFDHTRYNSEAITVEKRVGTYSSAMDLDFGVSGFSAIMLYLRGRESALVLSNSGTPVTGNFPKNLGGIFRQAQFAGALRTNFEFNFTLGFDAIHTQSANNGFKNGLTTITDIQNELSALGY